MSNRIIKWATDANYAAGGDPWNGQPNKVLPSAGQIQSGFVPNVAAPADYINYLFHVTANAVKGMAFSDVMNWGAPVVGILHPTRVKYIQGTFAAAAGLYYFGGDEQTAGTYFALSRSPDPGAPTTTDELTTAGITFDAGSGSSNFDVAPDGTIVVPGSGVTDGAKVLESDVIGTWTVHAAVFGSGAMVFPDVVRDPVNSLWSVAGHRSGGSLVDFYTSPDRVTWTARTAPTAIPHDGTNGPTVTLATHGGTIVAMLHPSSVPGDHTVNSISFSASTDGGITWSVIDTHTTAFASAGNGQFPKPVWTGTKWAAYVANVTDFKTYVYNSLDGITWTQVALLTTNAFLSMAADGGGDGVADDGVLLAVTTSGKLVYSLDAGATWTDANRGLAVGMANPARDYRRIVAVNGMFSACDYTNGKVRFSFSRSPAAGQALT